MKCASVSTQPCLDTAGAAGAETYPGSLGVKGGCALQGKTIHLSVRLHT